MSADAKAVALIDKLMLIHTALADPELSKADVTVLAILIEATNKLKGYAWASIETISNVAGVKRRYAQRVIKHLEEMGYVRVVLGGRGPKDTNRYFPNFQGRPSRPPLAIPRAKPKGDASETETPTPAPPKGGQFGKKGGLAGSEGRPARPPDTSYIPTDLETFRTHGTAASCGASSERGPAEKSLQEETAAKLRILEATMKRRNLDDDESERWREWLEVIVDCHEAHTGDPLGGWAYRLLDQLGG